MKFLAFVSFIMMIIFFVELDNEKHSPQQYEVKCFNGPTLAIDTITTSIYPPLNYIEVKNLTSTNSMLWLYIILSAAACFAFILLSYIFEELKTYNPR